MLTVLDQIVEQLAAFTVVGDYEQIVLGVHHPVQFDDVLVVIDLLHDLHLTIDLLHVVRGRFIPIDYLHGDLRE